MRPVSRRSRYWRILVLDRSQYGLDPMQRLEQSGSLKG